MVERINFLNRNYSNNPLLNPNYQDLYYDPTRGAKKFGLLSTPSGSSNSAPTSEYACRAQGGTWDPGSATCKFGSPNVDDTSPDQPVAPSTDGNTVDPYDNPFKPPYVNTTGGKTPIISIPDPLQDWKRKTEEADNTSWGGTQEDINRRRKELEAGGDPNVPLPGGTTGQGFEETNEDAKDRQHQDLLDDQKAYEDILARGNAPGATDQEKADAAAANPAYNDDVADAHGDTRIGAGNTSVGSSPALALADWAYNKATGKQITGIDPATGGLVIGVNKKAKNYTTKDAERVLNQDINYLNKSRTDKERQAAYTQLIENQTAIAGSTVSAAGIRNIGGDAFQNGDNYGLPSEYLVYSDQGPAGQIAKKVFGPDGSVFDSVEEVKEAYDKIQANPIKEEDKSIWQQVKDGVKNLFKSSDDIAAEKELAEKEAQKVEDARVAEETKRLENQRLAEEARLAGIEADRNAFNTQYGSTDIDKAQQAQLENLLTNPYISDEQKARIKQELDQITTSNVSEDLTGLSDEEINNLVQNNDRLAPDVIDALKGELGTRDETRKSTAFADQYAGTDIDKADIEDLNRLLNSPYISDEQKGRIQQELDQIEAVSGLKPPYNVTNDTLSELYANNDRLDPETRQAVKDELDSRWFKSKQSNFNIQYADTNLQELDDAGLQNLINSPYISPEQAQTVSAEIDNREQVRLNNEFQTLYNDTDLDEAAAGDLTEILNSPFITPEQKDRINDELRQVGVAKELSEITNIPGKSIEELEDIVKNNDRLQPGTKSILQQEIGKRRQDEDFLKLSEKEEALENEKNTLIPLKNALDKAKAARATDDATNPWPKTFNWTLRRRKAWFEKVAIKDAAVKDAEEAYTKALDKYNLKVDDRNKVSDTFKDKYGDQPISVPGTWLSKYYKEAGVGETVNVKDLNLGRPKIVPGEGLPGTDAYIAAHTPKPTTGSGGRNDRDNSPPVVNRPNASVGDNRTESEIAGGIGIGGLYNRGGTVMKKVGYNCGGSVKGGNYNRGGEININPSKEGQFTRRADSAGMGVQSYANKVLSAPEGKYTPEVRKQANFARNFGGINRNEGGSIPQYANDGQIINHPYDREGEQFDTVNANLTPGEFVIDADSTHKFKPILEAINNWEPGQNPSSVMGLLSPMGEEMVMKRKTSDGNEITIKSGMDSELHATPDMLAMPQDTMAAEQQTHRMPDGSIMAGAMHPGQPQNYNLGDYVQPVLSVLNSYAAQKRDQRQYDRKVSAADDEARKARIAGGITGLAAGAQNLAGQLGAAGLRTTSSGGFGPSGYRGATYAQNTGTDPNYSRQAQAFGQAEQEVGNTTQNVASDLNALDAGINQRQYGLLRNQELRQQQLQDAELARQQELEDRAINRQQEIEDLQTRYDNSVSLEEAKQNLKNSGKSTGWIADQTESQSKAFGLGNEAVVGDAEMTEIENSPGFDSRDIGDSFEQALFRNKDGDITGLRADVLNKLDKRRAAYLRATLKYITAKLRRESGAAISSSEWASELEKVVPSGPTEFMFSQANRKRNIQALARAAGAPSIEDFNDALGFDKSGYKADDWYNKVIKQSVTTTAPDGTPVTEIEL